MEVSDILDTVANGGKAGRDDIVTLLSSEGKDMEELFAQAREVRDKQFGNHVFAYGFVYFSTYCHNSCTFCYFRKSNNIDRYRKTPEEIVATAADLKDAGIDLVDLTMGEDEEMYKNGCAELLDIISRVKKLGISIMCSPGVVEPAALPKIKQAGADFFAIYQETHNRELYAKLRLNQDYDTRFNQRVLARKAGLLTEDGMMVGLGETMQDRADSILMMGEEGCEQIRCMTFVPQPGTPLQNLEPMNSDMELKSIAVMRILFPDRFIPATLDVEGVEGMKSRLDAGASTITSIVVPHKHYAGVAQPEKDIESGARSVQHVFDLVDQMGKKIATQNEFRHAIEPLEERIRPKD